MKRPYIDWIRSVSMTVGELQSVYDLLTCYNIYNMIVKLATIFPPEHCANQQSTRFGYIQHT